MRSISLALLTWVRNLRDDDRLPIAFLRHFDFRLRPLDHGAAAGDVRLVDPEAADNVAAGGEVGPGHELDDLALAFGGGRRRGRLRALDRPDDRLDHLAHVVRRDVRGHADRDAGGSVDEQVRERRRQDRRLLGRLVVVRDEVDGLLVEIRHHLVAEGLEASLGVPHRGRRIAVDRSEVPLAVDQRGAHVEVLRHPHERVVDRRVAVGMEVAHHLADDLGALPVAARRRQPHRLHAVQHAAMCRLQPVAHVGQRSSNDYAHGVIHVRPLHLVFDVDRDLVLRNR